ncbi:hypothetical protein QO003_000768 [Arthrobacter silviterrae]|uniref:Uncharacterized protein n=1 Tax=Arthrobacter silviterrae TaxID=2026658 RepID=A0ABX0DCQ7_9MICC|nr:hypothetical protein [Arthrobacter silviterrae]MDQ0276465.1 hypothetical protein [Arthrobacter silviterrae]NGN84697.1 hypothetical protein [Arthrobacter silviterrae]
MHGHPQVEAFRQAAELMRAERYWHRNDDDEIEFLRALAGVVSEVAYHLDAYQAMDPDGLAAYVCAARLRPWAGTVSAELLLVTAVDNVIERRIATVSAARNTGGQ